MIRSLLVIMFTLSLVSLPDDAEALNRDSPFRLVRAGTNKCLNLKQGNKANNTPIIQSDCIPGSSNQRWYVQSSAGGYQIKHLASGKCMTMQFGGSSNYQALVLWTCVPGAANQLFNMPYAANSNFFAWITPLHGPNKCVELGVSLMSQNPAIQDTCVPNAREQLFDIQFV
jgi:hypothetical protein